MQADEAWQAYLRTIADDEERRAALRVAAADVRFRAMQEQLLQMPRNGIAADDALRQAFLSASRDVIEHLYSVLSDVVDYQHRGAQLAHKAAAQD